MKLQLTFPLRPCDQCLANVPHSKGGGRLHVVPVLLSERVDAAREERGGKSCRILPFPWRYRQRVGSTVEFSPLI